MPSHVAIVGAGAAGLATAIFTRRLSRGVRVSLLDGARRPGAKILVSGGSRCNVTNASVTEHDFHGGSRAAIRQVLRALPVDDTVAFFREIGVPLREEELGKLFPVSNRSRDVLEALLREGERVGVERLDGHRVRSLARHGDGFVLETGRGPIEADRVVLATGGQSLPRSGSDGAGWELARQFGHSIVPPVPALVPLLLDAAAPLAHASLSGVSHDVEITVWIDGRVGARVTGSLLWTHFGISGPAALDASRHWTRGVHDGRAVRLTLAMCPGQAFDAMDAQLVALLAVRARAGIQTVLSQLVPAGLAAALLPALGIDPARTAGALSRELRRGLAHALVEWPLPVTGTRGYNHAEVTAGGVALAEVNPTTMESRRCAGLFLVGEMLDVDGRLGGFNFQWAWSSAKAAARTLARPAQTDMGSDPGV
ncbi:MAG TPA: aminoacetone oxidase family FAD-binding enzyme [Vicinamibacterales bacterium]|nr:aminoacetone oxidase family FAD-binding enzyme [Vicinamibacterales bacterium]